MKINEPTGDQRWDDQPDYTPEEVAEYLVTETPEHRARVKAVLLARQRWESEQPKPDLTVRCAEIRSKKKHCRHEMAWVYKFGDVHYCRYKLMPLIDATVDVMAMAHADAAKGHAGSASRMAAAAGQVHVGDVILEDPVPGMDGMMLMGCEPQHGNVAVSATRLIVEADSTRPTMNIYTKRRFVL